MTNHPNHNTCLPAGGQQWATPHHTNYSAGYTDSVRDVTRMMVNNPTLSSGVRSNIAQFISHKQGKGQEDTLFVVDPTFFRHDVMLVEVIFL